MSELLISGIISLITAVTVIIVSEFIKRRKIKKEKTNQINLEYLNPLRLYLEETFIRLNELRNRLNKNGKIEALTFIKNPEDVSSKSNDWFVKKGVYLISSCYFTACLLSMIKRLEKTSLI